MKLDKTKKYEFCGDVYSWYGGYWTACGKCCLDQHAIQHFADHGHVKEIREPVVFEGEVAFSEDEVCTCFTGITESQNLPKEQRKGKTFRVTWTEVVK